MERRSFLKFLVLLPFGGVASLASQARGRVEITRIRGFPNAACDHRWGLVVRSLDVETRMVLHARRCEKCAVLHVEEFTREDEPLTVAKLRELKETMDRAYLTTPTEQIFISKRHENHLRRLRKERDKLWGVSSPSLGR